MFVYEHLFNITLTYLFWVKLSFCQFSTNKKITFSSNKSKGKRVLTEISRECYGDGDDFNFGGKAVSIFPLRNFVSKLTSRVPHLKD